ncbi:sulfatase [Planctomycetota bacterium]
MNTHRCLSRGYLFLLGILVMAMATAPANAFGRRKRPNILWICIEDTVPLMSCYGEGINHTPNIDRLAQNGVRFANAFTPHPVGSPARSAIITGIYATTVGTHNHPSSRTIEDAIFLPDEVKTVPELFREAGYFTFNAGKDDYNFIYDRSKLYSGRKEMHYWYTLAGNIEDTWRNPDRAEGQPFFGQIQLKGGKHTLQQHTDAYHEALPLEERIDREKVKIPPYYPDHPIIREDWARHYDSVRITDKEVGAILAQLEEDDLLDNTIVFFFSDHGYKGTRHKHFLYDSGIRVPLLVMWKGNDRKIKPMTVREDMVSLLDVSATTLALAGIKIPKHMDGEDLFARGYKKRPYIIAARDRCDFTIDRIRSVRTEQYKYIRNFMTDRPLMQPNYRDTRAEFVIQKELLEQGKLDKVQKQFWSEERPMEELYDLSKDPHEINNVVKKAEYHEILVKMRRTLQNWIEATDDQGQYPEDIEGLRFMTSRWGGRCINPEYQQVWDNPMPGTPEVDITKESP